MNTKATRTMACYKLTSLQCKYISNKKPPLNAACIYIKFRRLSKHFKNKFPMGSKKLTGQKYGKQFINKKKSDIYRWNSGHIILILVESSLIFIDRDWVVNHCFPSGQSSSVNHARPPRTWRMSNPHCLILFDLIYFRKIILVSSGYKVLLQKFAPNWSQSWMD